MKTKIDIRVNGLYSLYIPAEGIDIQLLRNEFDLLTNDTANSRPLYITQTFEIPLEENRDIFDRLKGQDKTCQLLYNDVVVMTGPVLEYSVDEQKQVVLITIVSSFKTLVDFMGDNVLYLDKIDLSQWDYIVPETFSASDNNDLLKFGYYNPMDTNTGSITFDQSNIDGLCKPSISLLQYFKELFKLGGWTANLDQWTDKMQKTVLMPTVAYNCSSWGFEYSGVIEIPANSSVLFELSENTQSWNITKPVLGVDTPGAEILPGNKIQIRQPNRLQSFKFRAIYECPEAFDVMLNEGNNELAYIAALGDGEINYVTDNVNLEDGLDPLSVSFINPNPYAISINFRNVKFYNIFSIYETNQDVYIEPFGYRYTVADNYPQLTPLEVYRELLTLFQVAQTTDDEAQTIDYYYLNDIPGKEYTKIAVNPYLFWDGYEILSDKIEGLSKLNAIRYKDDTKRQRYFRVNISSLPSNGVYFESIFAHAETNNAWNAAQIPSLKYKTKTIGDNIIVEYLEYSDVSPQIGYYEEIDSATAKIIFQPLHISTLIAEYWNNFLPFLSSSGNSNPVVFNLKLRITYYQYLEQFAQRNLFYYKNDCLLIAGEYDVINETFTGTFISRQ